VVSGVLLLLALLLTPWWLTFALGLVAVFVFKDFYEIIILGFCFDLLYGPGHISGEIFRSFAGLLLSASVLLLATIIKTRLIVYNR